MRIFQRIHNKLNWSGRRYVALIVGMLFLGYALSAIYHVYKPLPRGLDFTGQMRHAELKLLVDQTYIDEAGVQQQDQQIFRQMLALIEQAKTTIVLDMFLFNAEVGDSTQPHAALTQALTQALVKKRQDHPDISITVITDPVNSVYGGTAPEHYRALRQAGVDLIETDLTPLRASNPLWSGFWYMCCQGLGNRADRGWLPNPVGEGKVTLRSYLNLINFKANHRKTMVVDSDQGFKSLISSANPHDGSSWHSNMALLISGATAMDVFKTEQSVALMSGGSSPVVIMSDLDAKPTEPQVQILTEAAIYQAVLKLINEAQSGEQLDMQMFYLSERKIIQALKQAKQRGVEIRLLLDPNKDAFGRQKNGIPNRPVASELHQAGIDIRWCDTHGEQCHSKMIMKKSATGAEIILGSANFTARNLKNYNLETDAHVVGRADQAVFVQAQSTFDQAWFNQNQRHISTEYDTYADASKIKYSLYRLMEWSGLSTF